MHQASSEPIPNAPTDQTEDPCALLPFTKDPWRDETGRLHRRRFWAATASGSYHADHKRGLEYADSLILYLNETKDYYILSLIMKDMKLWRYQQLCPVAVGFLQGIAMRAAFTPSQFNYARW